MNEKKPSPQKPVTNTGGSNHLLPKGIVTGNYVVGVDQGAGQDISAVKIVRGESTLPKWLATDPEVLAGQIQDILNLMRKVGWFVYMMPVTAANDRFAIRITISLPVTQGKIGVTGNFPEQQNITIDGKPVTEDA